MASDSFNCLWLQTHLPPSRYHNSILQLTLAAYTNQFALLCKLRREVPVLFGITV